MVTLYCQRCGREYQVEALPTVKPRCRCGGLCAPERRFAWTLTHNDRRFLRSLRIASDDDGRPIASLYTRS